MTENKYFGTDGYRGVANETLTSLSAYKVGRFLGWYFRTQSREQDRARIVIGKDTRLSSYMLEYSIAAGITASGADAYMLHVITTPGVSFVTRQESFDAGIMITASHNPYYDNGIKVIDRYGDKIDDGFAALIEKYIDGDLEALGVSGDLPLAVGEDIGRIIDHVAGRNRYLGYLISLAGNSYKRLRIGLDTANGAAWSLAPQLFSALGAEIRVIGNRPNGTNINRECGSTRIDALRELVRREHLDVGFAFDGDADRCIAVDERGETVDGDKMLYILAKRLKARGILTGDTVVATVMSNSGLRDSLKREGIEYSETDVGDRFVSERMQREGYSLGGEQSGHIIIRKYATTGDGLLTAIMLAEQMCDTKSALSSLCEGVMLYPQLNKSIRVRDKDRAFIDPTVREVIEEIVKEIDGRGRAILRKSGTEPVLRIMLECADVKKNEEYCARIENALRKGGHTVE